MQRTKKIKQVDAILTADWHLREDTPVCRTDDFEAAQWDMVKQVSNLQKKHSCPVLHAGDLFHHWKPSPRLLSLAIENLPDNFYTVYGNHDLPQHSLALAEKSGVYTLWKAGALGLLDKGHWGDEPEEPNFFLPWHPNYGNFDFPDPTKTHLRRAYVWHIYTYTGKPPYPGAEKNATGHYLLDKYEQFDLILTGDNHLPFVCEEDGRLLVNPGSLMRQTASQIDYRPAVWLYHGKTNTVTPHYLDIDTSVISRQHIEQKEERDERISAFIERLDMDWEQDLNFLENLKRFEQENDVSEEVMQLTYKALE